MQYQLEVDRHLSIVENLYISKIILIEKKSDQIKNLDQYLASKNLLLSIILGRVSIIIKSLRSIVVKMMHQAIHLFFWLMVDDIKGVVNVHVHHVVIYGTLSGRSPEKLNSFLVTSTRVQSPEPIVVSIVGVFQF